MSARLNMKPTGYIAWKGHSLNQITTIIQKNRPTISSETSDNRNLFHPLPLKITRRELLVEPSNNHIFNPRTSITLDEFEGPGRSIITPADHCAFGIQNTINTYIPNNVYENGLCTDPNVCLQMNAKRRVRSGGMYHQKFDLSKNNSKVYFADTNEYYMNRNKTYRQNSVITLRQGTPSILSGFASKTNFYVTTGLNKCNLGYVPNDENNNFFSYFWVNDVFSIITNERQRIPSYREVHIPEGYYTIESFNQRLEYEMEKNKHYLIENKTGAKIFLIKMIYNNYHDKIEIQFYPYSTTLYPEQYYSIPKKVNGELAWESSAPTVAQTGGIQFIDNTVARLVGYSPGYYPNVKEWLVNYQNYNIVTMPVYVDEPLAFLSNQQHHLFPMYTVVNYKPSNINYGTNGAVTSSTRTLQEKYTTVTENGTVFATANGKQVSNSVAYGVSEHIYTMKDKIGYPLRSTPVFPKYGSVDYRKVCSRTKNMYNG